MPLKPSPNICPICKKGNNFEFLRDYSLRDNDFSLYECVKCSVQFWEPFKNLGAKWYEAQEKYTTATAKEPRLYRGYHKKFLALYPVFPKNTKVLDIGCGRGEFLYELQKRGCECWGVDLTKSAIRTAKDRFNLQNLFAMKLEEFFQEKELPKFDIITSFEVIEHLDDPLSFIQGIKKHIKPKGKIILSTPSRERLMRDMYEWDFPPWHISRWNEKAMSNLFKKINFEISSIHYVDQFFHLFELFSEKAQFGLVKKINKPTQNKQISSIQTQPAQNFPSKPKLFTILIQKAAKLKNFIIAGIPAFLVWGFGKIARIKNGVMVIEFVPSKKSKNSY